MMTTSIKIVDRNIPMHDPLHGRSNHAITFERCSVYVCHERGVDRTLSFVAHTENYEIIVSFFCKVKSLMEPLAF